MTFNAKLVHQKRVAFTSLYMPEKLGTNLHGPLSLAVLDELNNQLLTCYQKSVLHFVDLHNFLTSHLANVLLSSSCTSPINCRTSTHEWPPSIHLVFFFDIYKQTSTKFLCPSFSFFFLAEQNIKMS